jgi:hypothetical protein
MHADPQVDAQQEKHNVARDVLGNAELGKGCQEKVKHGDKEGQDANNGDFAHGVESVAGCGEFLECLQQLNS